MTDLRTIGEVTRRLLLPAVKSRSTGRDFEIPYGFVPAGVDDARVRARLLEELGIEIGGGLGPFKGKAWRIGLMGASSTRRNVTLLLGALETLLHDAGWRFSPGAALAAAAASYA